MKAEQLMGRNVETCHPGDRLNAAARIMWERDCGCVPVVVEDGDGSRVVGMLTDRDVCMAAYTQGRALADIKVASAMAHDVCSCRTSDTVRVAFNIMRTNQLHRLPVLDASDHLVGIVTLADLAREAAREEGSRTKEVKGEDIAATIEAISQPRTPHDVMRAA